MWYATAPDSVRFQEQVWISALGFSAELTERGLRGTARYSSDDMTTSGRTGFTGERVGCPEVPPPGEREEDGVGRPRTLSAHPVSRTGSRGTAYQVLRAREMSPLTERPDDVGPSGGCEEVSDVVVRRKGRTGWRAVRREIPMYVE